MSIRPVQKSILDNKTRSSQRITRNSQIPISCQDIVESFRPSKKAKKRNNSLQFDIYTDIDIEIESLDTRESFIPKVLPKTPRITVEIPRRQPF